jgi:hypothetical protein
MVRIRLRGLEAFMRWVVIRNGLVSGEELNVPNDRCGARPGAALFDFG